MELDIEGTEISDTSWKEDTVSISRDKDSAKIKEALVRVLCGAMLVDRKKKNDLMQTSGLEEAIHKLVKHSSVR